MRDSSLNDLRYSDIKVEAIRDCVPEDLQLSYLFPLDKYHSRWEELDYSSFEGWKESFMNSYFTEEGRGFNIGQERSRVGTHPGMRYFQKKDDLFMKKISDIWI